MVGGWVWMVGGDGGGGGALGVGWWGEGGEGAASGPLNVFDLQSDLLLNAPLLHCPMGRNNCVRTCVY